MAIKKCPACRHQISSSARACPQCGDNLAARNSWWWVLGIFASIPVIALVGLLAKLAEPELPSEVLQSLPPPSVTLVQPISPEQLVNVPPDYQRDIVQMANLLKDQHPRCKERLDPLNIGLASEQDNPANPRYFAQCGLGSAPVVVWFTWMDAVNKSIPIQPAPKPVITERAAADACEQAAKADATIPATVDFSRFWSSAFRANSDGTAVYLTSFTAKNAFGMEFNFDIRCHFEGMSLSGAYVTPSS